MTELIEYLASEDLKRSETVLAWTVGIAIGIAVAGFFLLTVV
jgi:hypothetical protein